MLLTLYKIGGVHFRLFGANGCHFKAKHERFTAASSCCGHNLEYENFTSSFGRLRQKIVPQSVPHLQHDYFSSFNQSNHWLVVTLPSSNLRLPIGQARRQRQQERHKFAYLTSEWKPVYTFARAFFIFLHFAVVLVLSTTWNDQFGRCVDDESTWRQIFTLVFLSLRRWFQFNSRILRTKFANMTIRNN